MPHDIFRTDIAIWKLGAGVCSILSSHSARMGIYISRFEALICRWLIEQVWIQEPLYAALRVCLHRTMPNAHSLSQSIAIPYSQTCAYTSACSLQDSELCFVGVWSMRMFGFRNPHTRRSESAYIEPYLVGIRCLSLLRFLTVRHSLKRFWSEKLGIRVNVQL